MNNLLGRQYLKTDHALKWLLQFAVMQLLWQHWPRHGRRVYPMSIYCPRQEAKQAGSVKMFKWILVTRGITLCSAHHNDRDEGEIQPWRGRNRVLGPKPKCSYERVIRDSGTAAAIHSNHSLNYVMLCRRFGIIVRDCSMAYKFSIRTPAQALSY